MSFSSLQKQSLSVFPLQELVNVQVLKHFGSTSGQVFVGTGGDEPPLDGVGLDDGTGPTTLEETGLGAGFDDGIEPGTDGFPETGGKPAE